MSRLRSSSYAFVLLALLLVSPPRDGFQAAFDRVAEYSISRQSPAVAGAQAEPPGPTAEHIGILDGDGAQHTSDEANPPVPLDPSPPTAAPVAVPEPSATPAPTAAPSPTPTVIAPPVPTRGVDARSSKVDESPVRESSGRSARVPILMYHYIRVNPEPADRLGFNLSVTPVDFAAQMAYLADRGYQTIGLDELAGYLSGEQPAIPPRSVVLTFDDGYRDAYEAAYPVLRKNGFRATIFMITGLVGRPGYLLWDHLRELSRNGVSIGAHTVGHPDLARIGVAAATREISESKATLERELGLPTTLFSYPSGSYDPQVVDMVRRAGYQAAVTVKYGLTHRPEDRFTLARVRVSGGQSVARIAAAAGLD